MQAFLKEKLAHIYLNKHLKLCSFLYRLLNSKNSILINLTRYLYFKVLKYTPMVFVALNLIIPAILSAITCIFGNIMHAWWDFYIPILLYIAYFFGMVFVIFLFMFLSALVMKKPKGDFVDKLSKFSRFVYQNTLFYLIFIGRVRVKREGIEKVPFEQRFLLVQNHRSNYDPLISGHYLRKQNISWISKRSLFKMPLINRHMSHIGFMPMDREDLKQSMRVIIRACKYLSDDEISIGVFPEGTRNKNDNVDLLDFKHGCFKIALKTHVPIVVCVLKNADYIHRRWPWRSTHVYLKIIDVMYYDQYKDMTTVEISDYIREKMLVEYQGLKDYKA